MMKYAVWSGFAALVAAGGAVGQTQELFVYDQGGGVMRVIQGGSVIRSWNSGTSNWSPIAVSGGTVRASSYFDGGGGAEWDYFGVNTGNSVGDVDGDNIYDSTSDGAKNYAVAFTNRLYSYDPLFTNQATVNGNIGWFQQLPGGIAWDSRADTLWTSAWSGTNIREMDKNGNPTGRGFQAVDSLNMALAYEHVSDTLWVVPRDTGLLILRQYDLNGALLQTINLGISGNFLSAEFAAVPAPGAAALLGLGGVLAGRRRRA